MQRAFSYRDCATHLRPMTIAGSMFVAMLALSTIVPGTTIAGDNPQFQPILCESDEKDSLVESAKCLQQLKELATRDGDVLRLNLENGKTKLYTSDRKACEDGPWEKCVVFRLVAFYPSLQSFLVAKLLNECGYYELQSRRSGEIVELSTVPEWSPNGKYLVSVNDDSDLCRPFDYLVILSATDPPTLQLKHHLERYENWTIAGWDGDDGIKLQVHVGEPEGTYDQDVEAVRSGNRRKLVWGKITNVVPHEPGSQWTPPATPPNDVTSPGVGDRDIERAW